MSIPNTVKLQNNVEIDKTDAQNTSENSSFKKFERTLAGAVIGFVRRNQPTRLESIVENLESIYHSLRNISGAKYKGKDLSRAVRGLSHLKIFKISNNLWYINEAKAQEYETKKSLTFEKRKTRSRVNSKLPFIQSTSKIAKFIYMLEHYTISLKKDPTFSKIFKDPFKKIKGTETLEECCKKTDSWERMLGMIQGYAITANYFEELNSKISLNERSPELEDTLKYLLSHLTMIEELSN